MKYKRLSLILSTALFLMLNPARPQSITIPGTMLGSYSHVTVTFDGAPGNPTDWIAIHPFTGDNLSYLSWQYLSGQTSGPLTLALPDTNGIYDFRMYDHNNVLICRSEPFVFRKALIPGDLGNDSAVWHSDVSGLNLDDMAVAVKVDQQQRVVIAGSAQSGDTSTLLTPIVNFFVVRLLTDGQPDPSFGVNGRVITPIPGIEAQEVTAMVIQDDGKIVVGGSGIRYGVGPCVWTGDFILARYNTDGSLDSAFGNNGIVLTNFTWFNQTEGNSTDNLTCLALQPDGKILAGGYGNLCSEQIRRSNLVRYKTNGEPDSTFGLFGKYTYSPQAINEWITSIAPPVPGGDGSFYVAAVQNEWLNFYPNTNYFYKFGPTGTLIPGFGTNGYVYDPRPAMQHTQVPHTIITGPDGMLYLLGSTATPGNIRLMKKDPVTGADVPGFGTSGLVVNDYPVASRPTGCYFWNDHLVVGHHTLSGEWSGSRFSLSDGSIDPGFGWSRWLLHGEYDQPAAMIRDQHGNMIMAGSGQYPEGGQWDAMVVKLDTNTTRYILNQNFPSGSTTCNSSTETIYLRNTQVESGASTSLYATQNIRIFDGVHVMAGGYLLAQIDPAGYYCTKEAPLTSAGNDNQEETSIMQVRSADDGIRIFPNPANHYIRVELEEESADQTVSLTLTGMTGNHIGSWRFPEAGAKEIGLSGLPAGIYLLTGTTCRGTFVKKVIKY